MRKTYFTTPFKENEEDEYIPIRPREISSENGKEMIFGFGSIPDNFDTIIVRLPVIPYDDLCKNHGVPADLEHSILGWAAKHHYITGACLLTVLFLGFFSAYYYRLEQRYYAQLRDIKLAEDKEKYRSTYDRIIRQLKTVEIPTLNRNLAIIVARPENKRYSIFKNPSFVQCEEKSGEQRYCTALQFEQNFSMVNFIKGGWNALFIMAFFYWLGWIMTGTYFGILGIGFADCSAYVSFGVPIFCGALYGALKMYHWYQHRKQDCLPTDEERILANELMEKCLNYEEGEFAEPFARQHETNAYIQLLNAAQIAFAFVTNVVGAYTSAHYILWILGDLLPVLAQCTNFLGYGCFVVAAIAGLWHAYAKYNEVIGSSLTVADYNDFSENEKQYNECKININQLKNELQQNDDYVMTFARWVGKLLQNPYYQKLVNLISGIFIGRLFTLVLTSPYMPDAFNLAQVVSALSNPMVACIILGTGLAWMTIMAITEYLEKRATMHDRLKSAKEELRLVEIYKNDPNYAAHGFFKRVEKNPYSVPAAAPSAVSMQRLAQH